MNTLTYLQPSYPLDALPRVLRLAANEVHQNIQAPDALVGMAALASLSLACQGLVDVKLPTGQIRGVGLNLLGGGESGERKSTLDALFNAPFVEHDVSRAIAFQNERAEHEVLMDHWRAHRSELRKQIAKRNKSGAPIDDLNAELAEHLANRPQPPRLRRFIRQDITARAVMDALSGDGVSMGLITDEGDQLFSSDAMSNIGLLNRIWDGPALLSIDRAEFEHVLVTNPRMTIFIQTQTKVFSRYMERHGDIARSSGHFARYLVGWPTSTQGYRTVATGELTWEHLPALHTVYKSLIARYQAMVRAGRVVREVVVFGDDAKARWFELAARTESMLRPGDYLNDIHDFGAKAMENVGRVAALFHYIQGEQGSITLDTLNRAFAVVGWHIDEAKRLFSADFVQPQEVVDAQAVAWYLRKRYWGGIGSRSWLAKNRLLRNGPVRNRNRLNDALNYLVGLGAVWIGITPSSKQLFVNMNDPFFAAMC